MTKTKITLLISFTFLFLIILTLAGTKFFKHNNRKSYEEYLISKFQEFEKSFTTENTGDEAADQPEASYFQNYIQTIDYEQNRVPLERLLVAYNETKKLERQNKSTSNIIWEGTQSDMGGRTRSLMFDPNDVNGNKLWAGSVTGGLWYNNDISDPLSVWNPVNDLWENLSISSITYDPNNSNIFYAGTGEAETAVITYRESSGRGVGVWKSTDGGATWNLLTSTSDFKYITDVVVRNENTQSVIYASVVSGIYKGVNHLSEPSDGLYRSADGGITWEQVLPYISGFQVPYTPSDIEIGADGRIYVGTMPNIDGNGGATILYSDLGTSGSWTVFDNYEAIIKAEPSFKYPGRVKLAASQSNENIIYALIGAGTDDVLVQTFRTFAGKYILRTDDKGLNWVEKNLPPNVGSNSWAYLSWHAMVAEVDPNNPDVIYAGGLDVNRSSDGGNTWQHLSDWSLMYYGGGDAFVHADIHSIVYKSGNSDIAAFGTDGGVFFSENAQDIAPIFQQRNKNYNTLQYYTCDIISNSEEIGFIGGLQDNGSHYYNGNPLSINDMTSGGDGAYCFFDENENIFMTSVYNNGYDIYKDGNYWDYTSGSSGTFVSAADYDSDANILYCNAAMFTGNYNNKILRVTIPDVNQLLISLNTNSDVPFSVVKICKYSTTENKNLYLGTMSGRLYKVENINTTPIVTELTDDNFPMGNISSIEFGKDEDEIIVSFSNYGVTSVWKSYNNGLTWEEKEGNLPDMPIRWILANPQNQAQVMLATEIGVWTTENIDATAVLWQPANEGLANVRVDMLAIRESDNKVVAATHGRGLFSATFETIFSDIPKTEKENNLTVFPNPLSGNIKISVNKIISNANFQIYSLSGKKVYEQKFETFDDYTLNLDFLDNGIYFITITDGNEIMKKKVVVNK